MTINSHIFALEQTGRKIRFFSHVSKNIIKIVFVVRHFLRLNRKLKIKTELPKIRKVNH